MKFEEVFPLFREGRRIRKPGTAWFKFGVSNGCELGMQLLLADDLEVERQPIKYSVELWGNEWKPALHSAMFSNIVAGFDCLWGREKDARRHTKYRITVEEVPE